MRAACFIALVLLLAGCSDSEAGPTMPGAPAATAASEVSLVNATSRPFAYFVFAADLAPLLDPIPELRVDDSGIHLIAPGEVQPLGDVPGRAEAPRGGIAVYLYALSSDGLARFSRVELVSGPAIRQAGGRIVIRRVE